MLTLLVVLIAIVSIFLIAAVLIQNPKGGVDSTFGGGAANEMFGAARSTELIEKITWGLAAALFSLCILATLFINSGGASAIELTVPK
jgi:preprotein translocase subunit SecG